MNFTMWNAPLQHEFWGTSQCDITRDLAMKNELWWMSWCNLKIDGCHNTMLTLMNVAMWHNHWWLLHCNMNFDERHNETYPLMDVVMLRKHWCMFHYDIAIDECHNVTSIIATWILMNFTMWHNIWGIWQCKENFYEHCDVT